MLGFSGPRTPDVTSPKLTEILNADPHLRRPLAEALHGLYMELMKGRYFKEGFSFAYMRAYSNIAAQFARGVGPEDHTLLEFGVHVFTVPSLVDKLVREGNALHIICEALRVRIRR